MSRWYRQGRRNTCYYLLRISSVSEYELEAESNAESVLSNQSLSTPPLLILSSLSLLLPPSYEMSQQSDYSAIIRRLQEQITTLSEQVVARTGGGVAGLEVAKPQVFNGTPSKVSEFVTACKLYGKTKMREVSVEKQIQWVLSHVQGEAADVWKENMLEELEAGELEFETIGEFLVEVKKEFGGGKEESVKAVELRKLEQGGRTMEEFVQEFKRAARESGYKGRLCIEEFKRGMNRGNGRKLIEAENQPDSIEQ